MRKIALRLMCSPSAIGKILQRLKFAGSCEIRKRSGRPRKVSKSDNALLKMIVMKDPAITSTDLRHTNPFLKDISLRTIRR